MLTSINVFHLLQRLAFLKSCDLFLFFYISIIFKWAKLLVISVRVVFCFVVDCKVTFSSHVNYNYVAILRSTVMRFLFFFFRWEGAA